MAEETMTRLLSPADLDPERWKPMVYGVSIDVPIEQNGVGRGFIQFNHQPIFVTRAAAIILGNTFDPETSGLYQDGQYLITMNDEQRYHQNVPIHADLLWGPKIEGPWRTFEYPIYYLGGHAVRFELTNVYARILTPTADTYRVQISLSGLADWGSLTGPRMG